MRRASYGMGALHHAGRPNCPYIRWIPDGRFQTSPAPGTLIDTHAIRTGAKSLKRKDGASA